MSRCFPYPPPGFEGNLALIESRKLQKEKEKAEKERKRKGKKEKKDKSKKDERPKKRLREESAQKSIDKKRLQTEDLERSSLTEELDSVAVPQTLYDSSDACPASTQNAPAASSTPSQGSGIRIRLPLLRHTSKSAESPSSADQPCFSGRTVAESKLQEESVAGESSKRKKSSSRGGGSSSSHRQFKKLIRDFVPSPLVPAEEDVDWLSAGRGDSRDRCRSPVSVYALQMGKATFAPELGVYMLPYVVPF